MFSILRHGPNGDVRDQLTLELPEGATAADVLGQLDAPRCPIVISINDRLADLLAVLHDGDEVMLIPTVAGG